MAINRRKFLKFAAAAGGTAACGMVTPSTARASEPGVGEDGYGMLNDSVLCVGCKACQSACKKENNLKPEAEMPETLYDSPRSLSEHTYTLIKMHREEGGEATFVKQQCMHCVDPACQSACLVGALKKQENGAVTWAADKCMGCRYCMVACPYNVPQFEWKEAVPDIRKCTLCNETRLKKGLPTACSSVCPRGAIVFGKREDLLGIARKRIADRPDLYLDHIYGEKEIGGTGVIYLSKKNVAFASLGLPSFGPKAPPRLTEGIQHGVFKYFIPPVAIYAALGGIMAYTNRKNKHAKDEGGSHE
jgi:Fe-S-cluster-containing dehydrogenase component